MAFRGTLRQWPQAPMDRDGNPLAGHRRSGTQRQGRWAEQRALRLLTSRGWTLLSRNWGCRWGELDLVVAKPGRLLLVEVKGRRSGRGDRGARASLGAVKRRRLERTWRCWLAAHPHWAEWPVEQVAALVTLPPGPPRVVWIRMGG